MHSGKCNPTTVEPTMLHGGGESEAALQSMLIWAAEVPQQVLRNRNRSGGCDWRVALGEASGVDRG
jgi:hypothetical protein